MRVSSFNLKLFIGFAAVIVCSMAARAETAAVAKGKLLRGLSLLPPGSHCVAYRTKKSLLLIYPVTVVGKSCEVSAQVIPETDSHYHVEMNFPISSLASGESERDRDVLKLLKADVQPDMQFRTKSLTAEEWQKLVQLEHFPLSGEIVIGGEKFPIVADVVLIQGSQGLEIDGVVRTKFRDFKIDPPTLGAGLMAKVKEDLELHFHLLAFKTLGIDALVARKN